MEEPEVKIRFENYLKKQGYIKVEKNGKPQMTRGFGNTYTPEPNTDEQRNVRLDYYIYKDSTPPEVTWVECKGDLNLSGLLEGFVRVEYAIWLNGGQGLFVCPTEAINMMLEIREFLSKAVSNQIQILNAETMETYQL